MPSGSINFVRSAAFTVNNTVTKLELPASPGNSTSQSAILQNLSAVIVEVGGPDLTFGQGIQVAAGQSFTMDVHAGAWYAIVSAGTAACRLLEGS
jgi:hypothetical protein